MKVLFSGGGTLGSVSPLIAIQEAVQDGSDFIWIGTRFGPEKNIIEEGDIRFYQIFSGKIRRYFSFKNFLDPFKVIIGLIQSLYILSKEKPDVCVTAGSFVSIPVHLAAWILGVPTWVHQQDVKPGLSNKIMARFADKVTVSLEDSVKNFSSSTECIGNPVREEIYQGREERAKDIFNIESEKPVIFALGGGTGAEEINDLILGSLNSLDDFEIIHIVGPKRDSKKAFQTEQQYKNYHVFEFLGDEIKHAYKIADIVVCRAGFSTLTELSALEIPAILVPKEGHQEKNAEVFCQSDNFLDLKEKDFKKSIEKLLSGDKFENKKTLKITKRDKIKEILNEL